MFSGAVFFTVNNIAPAAPPAAIQAALDPRPASPANESQEAGSVATVLDSQSLKLLEALSNAGSQSNSVEVRNSDAPRRKP